MLPIFFSLSLCFHAHWFASPWGNVLPDQTRAGFLFNLIRSPLGYQYIGTSSFPDPFHFTKSHTNPKHHRDWKTQTSSTKFWSRPRLFSFIPFSELQTKKNRTASWAGEFFDRIAFFAVYPSTIWNQLDECLSYSRFSHRFLKTEPPTPKKKLFPIPRKSQILKKNLESI